MLRRSVLVLFASSFLLAASACSTSKSAETGDSPKTSQQTQTVEKTEDSEAESTTTRRGPSDQASEKAQGPEKAHEKMSGMCPMQVDGTTRKVVKLDGAVAMDFTTTGDVDEVRTRVQKMAAMHNKMHVDGDKTKKGKMKGHAKGKKKGHGKGKMADKKSDMMKMMDGVSAETRNIDRGMRMTLTPDDPAKVDQIYTKMKQHGEKMGDGGACPMKMMESHGRGSKMKK